VHTRRANGERHVEPVVEEERHRERLAQRARCRGECSGIGVLEAELHGGDAPPLGREAELHEVAAAEEGVVGDQHESEDLR